MQIWLQDLQGVRAGVGFGQWDTTERIQKDLNVSPAIAIKGQKADVKFFQSCIIETNLFVSRKLFYTISL